MARCVGLAPCTHVAARSRHNSSLMPSVDLLSQARGTQGFHIRAGETRSRGVCVCVVFFNTKEEEQGLGILGRLLSKPCHLCRDHAQLYVYAHISTKEMDFLGVREGLRSSRVEYLPEMTRDFG